MTHYDFYPLLIIDGVEPISYNVKQEFNGCQITIKVIANYESRQKIEKWHYYFYLWRMPTHEYGVFNVWLSCFERKK